MNTFPIATDVIAHGAEMVVGIEPVTDFDTGAQKTDKDGTPKWKIQFVYLAPGARKRELVEVGFASHKEPEFAPGSVPVFKGLVGRHWSNENAYGYSSGVALSAEEVGFRSAPSVEREPVAA